MFLDYLYLVVLTSTLCADSKEGGRDCQGEGRTKKEGISDKPVLQFKN